MIMLRIASFESSHLIGAIVHPKQAQYQYLLGSSVLPAACTFFEGNDVVAVGGVVETEDGMDGWLLFTDKMKPRHMLPVFRACARAIIALQHDGMKVVADVDADYPEAARMIVMLGFAPLRSVMLDGQEMTRMSA